MYGKDLDHIPDNLVPIRSTQNKIIRAIFGKRLKNKNNSEFTSSSPLYKKLNVLKFHDLYYYNLSLLAFNFFHNDLCPDAIKTRFTLQNSQKYDLKNKNDEPLTYSVPKLDKTYRKPIIAASLMWNKIPADIKSLSKNKFKNELKKFLMKKYVN